MTLSSQGQPEGDRPGVDAKGKKIKVDQDIRNHPDYKMPWWRKPMGPVTYWVVAIGALIIVAAAIVISLQLGVRLF